MERHNCNTMCRAWQRYLQGPSSTEESVADSTLGKVSQGNFHKEGNV